VPLLGANRGVEVKRRADGFREIYKRLNGADVLVLRADRSEPLVVVPLKFAAAIAALAERNKEFLREQGNSPNNLACKKECVS
jgi:hypothetical protein